MLHWLNYLGFRNMTELEGAAGTFEGHFYGHFVGRDTFKDIYDIGPDEYVDL